MKKLLGIVCLSFIIQFIVASNDLFQIIPLPQSVKLLKGKGLHYNEVTYVNAQSDSLIPILGTIVSGLSQSKKTGKGIELKLSTSNKFPVHKEAYMLELSCKGVTIIANTKVGLFYGCQTLEQLLEDSRDFNVEIPAMVITDYPDLDYRAVHFDTKHHLSNIEYYYRSIDKLSKYKINAVIWEIEDKLKYSRRPEIASPNAISKQEMQAISDYAIERNVEISPLVQGLGHASFILKHHWELRENPASDWEFCPSNPKTYEMQFALYDDAMEAMPHGKYLHVGGDEVSNIGICERCLKTGKPPFELQMMWLRKVSDFLVKKGRVPIFWDDMPLKYAGVYQTILSKMSEDELAKKWNSEKLDEAVHLFPKDCVFMRWNYWDPTQPAHKKILEWYKNKGLRVMAATAASAGDSPFMPRENSKAQYIKDFSNLVAENKLLGILSTAWDDGSAHWETIWRGFIAQGEFGWNAKGRNVESFKRAHSLREFGLLGTSPFVIFLDSLEINAFFFDHALITSGHRNPAGDIGEFSLIDLPNRNKKGEWSRINQKKIDEAFQAICRYNTIKKLIQEVKKRALRNRYTIDVYEQLNELFSFPGHLIISLNKYDQAKSDKAQKEAIREISEIINNFQQIKENYILVLGKTRFMEMPEGYIADQNHHKHLSALTQNSDWIFLFENPMVEKIKQWIQND